MSEIARSELAPRAADAEAAGDVSLVLYDVTVRREALVVRLEVKDLHRKLLP